MKFAMKFVELKNIFQVNPTMDLEIEHIGNERVPIVTVPNFYKRPQNVRRFVQDIPAPNFKRPAGSKNFEDYFLSRQSMNFKFGYEGVMRAVTEIVRQTYGVKVQTPPMFTTNVFQLKKPQAKHLRPFPHQDFATQSPDEYERNPPKVVDKFNAVIFLNTKQESRGGTAFYRDKMSGMESVPLDPRKYRHFWDQIAKSDNIENGYDYWHQAQSETWDVHHISPMIYNSLLIFPSHLFHSWWHLPHQFVNYPRITQVLFSVGDGTTTAKPQRAA